jgi:hypothetical protein
MKVLTTDAETWWVATTDEIKPPGGFVLRDFLEGIATRYRFLGLPHTFPPPEGAGYAFTDGSLPIAQGRVISIRSMTLFSDGVHIKVESTTEDADTILSDLWSYMISIGFQEPSSQAAHYHTSQIVADFSVSASHCLKQFDDLNKLVTDLLDIRTRDLRIGLLVLAGTPEPHHHSFINKLSHNMFRLEPRLDSPVANRYFTVANATTENHIRILEALEQAAQS